MTDPIVRFASAEDAPALTGLRFAWSPVADPASSVERTEFASHLENWMRRNRDRCLSAIATVDGEPVGMAWLAIYERVPNPEDRRRRSADVQSVFVTDGLRGRGIGTRLVRLLLEEADRLGIAKVTVDSSGPALPFYRRLGFGLSDRLLQRLRPNE